MLFVLIMQSGGYELGKRGSLMHVVEMAAVSHMPETAATPAVSCLDLNRSSVVYY